MLCNPYTVMAAEYVKMFGSKKSLELKCQRPNESTFRTGPYLEVMVKEAGLEKYIFFKRRDKIIIHELLLLAYDVYGA